MLVQVHRVVSVDKIDSELKALVICLEACQFGHDSVTPELHLELLEHCLVSLQIKIWNAGYRLLVLFDHSGYGLSRRDDRHVRHVLVRAAWATLTLDQFELHSRGQLWLAVFVLLNAAFFFVSNGLYLWRPESADSRTHVHDATNGDCSAQARPLQHAGPFDKLG